MENKQTLGIYIKKTNNLNNETKEQFQKIKNN